MLAVLIYYKLFHYLTLSKMSLKQSADCLFDLKMFIVNSIYEPNTWSVDRISISRLDIWFVDGIDNLVYQIFDFETVY